jgi:hypothetical protein
MQRLSGLRAVAIVLVSLLSVAQGQMDVPSSNGITDHENWLKSAATQQRCGYSVIPAGGGFALCSSEVSNFTAPGWSVGYLGGLPQGTGGWFVTSAKQIDTASWSAGISNGLLLSPTKYAVGDFNPFNMYATAKGGLTAPSDEGVVASRVTLFEQGTVNSGSEPLIGTVVPGSGEGGQPSIECTVRCFSLGVGHPLIDKTTGVYAGRTTAVAKKDGIATITISGFTVPAASRCGTTEQAIATPVQSISKKTPETFVVKVPANGAGDFRVGDVITIANPFIENAVVSAAPGSAGKGVQTITAGLTYPYYPGATVCAGGLAGGYFMEQTAYTYNPGTTLPPTSITAWAVKGGVATLTGNNGLKVGESVRLSGFASTSNLNGQTGPVVSVISNAGGAQTGFTMAVSRPDGGAKSAGVALVGTRYLFPVIGSVTSGAAAQILVTSDFAGGLNSGAIQTGPIMLYPGATVVDSGNSSGFSWSNPVGKVTLELDPNTVAWHDHDAVENASLTSASYLLQSNNLVTLNPYARLNGLLTNVWSGGLASPEPDTLVAAYKVESLVAHGGMLNPPWGLHLKTGSGNGSFAGGLWMDYAPEGGVDGVSGAHLPPCVLCVGPFSPGYVSPSKRMNPDYYVFLGLGTGDGLLYTPGTHSFEWRAGGGINISSPLTISAGLTMAARPIHQIANGVARDDAATVGQLPLAATLTTRVSGGPTASVSLPGMTARGHCTLGATNAAAAANLATTFVSGKAAGSITVSYRGPAGMTFDVLCTSY